MQVYKNKFERTKASKRPLVRKGSKEPKMLPLFGLSLHKQNKRFGSSTQHNPHLVHTVEEREKRSKEGRGS